jgi:magnesium-protoporphyrin O-methyltransferase
MTCEHCCGAQKLFGEREAAKEVRRYRKKGPRKTTRRLLEGVADRDIEGLSLLDIGGGIGAVQIGLLERGLAYATDVDASTAYLNTARQEMEERGLDQKTRFIEGDFLDLHQEIESHDIVTLEKVLCCYPDMEGLLEHSLAKCKRFYGLVYPRDGVVAGALTGLANLFFWLQGNPFRTYIHPVRRIRRTLAKHGMRKVYSNRAFPWIIEWYAR